STEFTPWNPTLDGPLGLYSDFASKLFALGRFARIPFITGTNLDEDINSLYDSANIDSTQTVRERTITNYTPPAITAQVLNTSADQLLALYPVGDPALGSPFNTGNETFGLSPVYKPASAIFGDLSFTAPWRSLSQTAAGAGVKTFNYLFAAPSTSFPPSFGDMWRLLNSLLSLYFNLDSHT
ncbi:hypothetical protein M422DRAFT_155801, partial [Sphaerobolus stellatus SS14]